ncbi:MAG: DUF1015 domain-containing protein [Anaerolineae bacterium]|nr:DUF1015 domain-containing protein [Anaerolineae bacterium]
MVEIKPFRGLRYNPQYARPGVFAPPYDVIDYELKKQLLQRDPYNVVRLILKSDDSQENWHQAAAQTLHRWITQRILIQDQTPALYGYQQTFSLPNDQRRTRTGFLARILLQPWGQSIHRHEYTRQAPRLDRLKLLRATRTNMSPVFGLYRDPDQEVLHWLTSREEAPLLSFEDEEHVQHIFWRITHPQAIEAICQTLAKREIVIADGHHRYETALAYQKECREAKGDPPSPQPYDYTLIYLSAAEDPGICILATHRVLGAMSLSEEELLKALEKSFNLQPVKDQKSLSLEIAREAKRTIAIGLYLPKTGKWILKLKDKRRAIQSLQRFLPSELAELDVVILQRLILEPLLGLPPHVLSTTDHVSYTIDENKAAEMVRTGQAKAAFILNPTRIDQVWTAAVHDIPMPPTSTYFYPKLLTGLVFNPLY